MCNELDMAECYYNNSSVCFYPLLYIFILLGTGLIFVNNRYCNLERRYNELVNSVEYIFVLNNKKRDSDSDSDSDSGSDSDDDLTVYGHNFEYSNYSR